MAFSTTFLAASLTAAWWALILVARSASGSLLGFSSATSAILRTPALAQRQGATPAHRRLPTEFTISNNHLMSSSAAILHQIGRPVAGSAQPSNDVAIYSV